MWIFFMKNPNGDRRGSETGAVECAYMYWFVVCMPHKQRELTAASPAQQPTHWQAEPSSIYDVTLS